MPERLDRNDDVGAVLLLEEGGRGGVADYAGELACALAARGRQVELVTSSDHLYAASHGVRVLGWMRYVRGTSPLGRALRRVQISRVLNGLSYLVMIPRVLRLGRRCSVAHLQGGEYLPLTALLAALLRAARVPLVYTPHNTFDRGRPYRRSRQFLGRCADRTIVHTRFDLDQLPVAARGGAVVVPHGEYGGVVRRAGPVDRSRARSRLRMPDDVPVTLLFGALRPDKGLSDLLQAALEVPHLHVLVVGEEAGALAAAADLLGSPRLTGRVHLRKGFQPMSEVATAFAAADTVALPYRRASQSGVLMLAYGFARPVIVYPTGGLPEAVIPGETGWVCARADPTAMRDALLDAARVGPDECLRRGRAGELMSRERFSWSKIAARTDALYAELERVKTA